MTKYVSLTVLTMLQIDIMRFVDTWARDEKTPTPRKEIMNAMEEKKYTKRAVKYSIEGLLREGYIRVAVIGADQALNHKYYVQLRKV